MKILDLSTESLILALISGSRWVLKLEQLFQLKVRKAEKRAGEILCLQRENTAKKLGGQAGTPAHEALSSLEQQSFLRTVALVSLCSPVEPLANFS